MEIERSLKEDLDHLNHDFDNISDQIETIEDQLKQDPTPKNYEALQYELEVLKRRRDQVWQQIVNRQLFH